jgi:hypothetical protein
VKTRRTTVIALALLGLMVLVVTISPPDQGPLNGSAASVTPTATASAKPLTDPDAFDVSMKLSTAPGAAEKTVDAELGDRVQIVVDGTDPDSVALGDLAVEDVDAVTPAVFELLADTPGTYPLVLLSDDRRLGTLEIR